MLIQTTFLPGILYDSVIEQRYSVVRQNANLIMYHVLPIPVITPQAYKAEANTRIPILERLPIRPPSYSSVRKPHNSLPIRYYILREKPDTTKHITIDRERPPKKETAVI